MHLIVSHLPPSILDHLLYLEESLNRFPGRDTVVLGDLNADIGRLRNPLGQQVAYLLVSFGLADLLVHFLQRFYYRHLHMLWQVCQCRVLRSRCGYVMGSDQSMFKK